ncbi:GxxExxY protein [Aliifodinibius sp. S!AR15-10]|uniref:GxxExxY protein n=1 Tax=Aliifodinibius sp. S!AR15-10 TaxID=2950437 RepID=UPI002858F19E|nr:GxxExxY protein [Aliifodinibius sp. S!AR15-10]MDR8392335.1 GxxExxY protein [Aliifodinibius sp. S!AR15-10]
MELNQLSYDVIGCAIRVHKELGPGLLESAYHECLYYLLEEEGIYTEKEKAMPVIFEGVELDCGYRIDLLIENKLVVELKTVEKIHDVHLAQVLSYLKLGDFNLGLLINFNVNQLKQGIKRIAN